jgi:hypothetical protein
VLATALFVRTWQEHDRLEQAVRLGRADAIEPIQESGRQSQALTRLFAGITVGLGAASLSVWFLSDAADNERAVALGAHGAGAGARYTTRF